MIDWMTLHLDYRHLPKQTVETLSGLFDRVCCYDPHSGDVRWETSAWQSVRSDSHTLAIRAGTDRLSIQGSPARIMGNGDNTFGHPRHHSNMALCAQAMIDAAERGLTQLLMDRGGIGVIVLPRATQIGELQAGNETARRVPVVVMDDGSPVTRLVHPFRQVPMWVLGRLDITYNYVLPSLEDVRSALSILRGVEGGRYRVSGIAGDTVYWSKTSRRRKGKAYAKGPHLQHLIKKRQLGATMSAEQLAAANRILRLEMTVLRKWLDEKLPELTKSESLRWWELNPEQLFDIHNAFFGEMIGDDDVPESNVELMKRVLEIAPSESQGRAAWMTWMSIQSQGWEMTKSMMTKSTWYRHRSILRDAGLSDADLSLGRVVPLRRTKLLDLRPVESWQALCA